MKDYKEPLLHSQRRAIEQYANVDRELLQNLDKQTMEVSFDQNRQLLRGFCLLFKKPMQRNS